MRWLFVCALLLAVGFVSAKSIGQTQLDDVDEEEARLVKELEQLIKTGQKSRTLTKITNLGPNIRDLVRRGALRARNAGICTLCNAAMRVLINFNNLGVSRDEFLHAANVICVNARIETERVCKGVIDLNADTFLYIFDHKKDLTPSKICSILAQPLGCEEKHIFNLFGKKDEWSIKLAPGPKIYPTPAQTSDPPLKIAQITDIHFDDIYKVGGNTQCNEPLCCGENQGEPATPADAAGYWGDYRYCDTPWHSVQNAVTEMAKQKYDYVYYTGDAINHRVWETTRIGNINNIKKINQILKDTFQGTQLYPLLGNHESNPLDLFSPQEITDPNLSTQWLYDTAAADWSSWLPNSTAETIRRGGFYTVVVKPGWRIIALNSNVGYVWNWWLLYNDVDPYGQLQWLADTLAQAEQNREFVHILSHVPTGDDTCHIKWAHEYNRIVERFSHIISVQFNGHSHYDEFNVFYSNKQPVNVAYNGGSVTTYYYMNPNYKVYDVSPSNYKVLDYAEYTFNLTLANLMPDVAPQWFKLYSFKEAWNVNDMTDINQINNVVKDIASSKNQVNQYFRFKVREGDPYMAQGCNEVCQEELICRIVTTEFGNREMCNQVLKSSYLQSYRM